MQSIGNSQKISYDDILLQNNDTLDKKEKAKIKKEKNKGKRKIIEQDFKPINDHINQNVYEL